MYSIVVWILGLFVTGLFFAGFNTFRFIIVCVLQRPEDEEMLVPHSDLAENNHQPMDGIVILPFVLFDP